MSIKINRVTTLADLPADLAENVHSWRWSDDLPLTSEDGERGERTLTGYADAGTTADGWHLFILRFDRSTFTYGYYSPGGTSMTVGSRNDHMTKAAVLEWVREQYALDLDAAREAGTTAYNAGRPMQWWACGEWGAVNITDPDFDRIAGRVWGLARTRLGRAFNGAWEDNARHDRDRQARLDAEREDARRPAAAPTRLDKRQQRRAARRAARLVTA